MMRIALGFLVPFVGIYGGKGVSQCRPESAHPRFPRSNVSSEASVGLHARRSTSSAPQIYNRPTVTLGSRAIHALGGWPDWHSSLCRLRLGLV